MRQRGILVVDYGSQYNELVARRVRQAGVYSQICSFKDAEAELASGLVAGVILTGGPMSVYEKGAFPLPDCILKSGLPVLGICYGFQLLSYAQQGRVAPLDSAEYGDTVVFKSGDSPLLDGVPDSFHVFMSHRDCVVTLPAGYQRLAYTAGTPNAIAQDVARKQYGVQFHPEVNDTQYGQRIIENFLFKIVGAKKDWSIDSIISDSVDRIRAQVGDGRVLLGLSGGVDSSVCAALISKAIGQRLSCVFVDHGLLRKNEARDVIATFQNFDLDFHPVDASEKFFHALSGVTDPEAKRKVVGQLFIDTFRDEAKKLGTIDYLAQGTIYPDVVESGQGGNSARIKSHHNVGGLPADIGFKGLVEPLRYLFKDEVRELGRQLGLPDSLVFRQPFPGPGLSIRIIGEVTPEKVRIVQDADQILREEIEKAGLARKISQYYAALSNMRTVGVKGDGRSYDYACVIRAVQTIDFMTAKPFALPFDLLTRIADRIVDEVVGINRVLFDCTSKPPATIEME
ncbi:MAG TPA: GMP synthase (glutamine-hydrolyzing) [Firmicutes bacterium]|nr:GMP synthase (glutamine-hydrolyzing) [Bacillota bacterium]